MGGKQSSTRSRDNRTPKHKDPKPVGEDLNGEQALARALLDEPVATNAFRMFMVCDALCFRVREVPSEHIGSWLQELEGKKFMGASFESVTEHTQLLLLCAQDGGRNGQNRERSLNMWLAMHVGLALSRQLTPFALPSATGFPSASLASLPEDILCLIAVRLNVPSLCALACACKRLRNLTLKPRVWIPHMPATPRISSDSSKKNSKSKVNCQALYDFEAAMEEELTLKKDEVVQVLKGTLKDDWITVQNANGATGLIPSTYVKPAVRPTSRSVHLPYRQQFLLPTDEAFPAEASPMTELLELTQDPRAKAILAWCAAIQTVTLSQQKDINEAERGFQQLVPSQIPTRGAAVPTTYNARIRTQRGEEAHINRKLRNNRYFYAAILGVLAAHSQRSLENSNATELIFGDTKEVHQCIQFLALLYSHLGRTAFLPAARASTRLEKALQRILVAEYKWLEGFSVTSTILKHSYTGLKELKDLPPGPWQPERMSLILGGVLRALMGTCEPLPALELALSVQSEADRWDATLLMGSMLSLAWTSSECDLTVKSLQTNVPDEWTKAVNDMRPINVILDDLQDIG